VIIFDASSRQRLLSRFDPRARILVVVLFAVLICLASQIAVLLLGLSAAVLLLLCSDIGTWKTVKRLGALNLFMLFLAITLPLFTPGEKLFQIGFVSWSREGLWRAAQIALRANAAMIMLTALVGSMEPPHLGFALDGLGVPNKFTHLLLFMVRYIEVIHQEYHRLRDAMLLRGFRARFDGHTCRSFGYLVGQLLVRSVNRSERIMDAMKCRGFRGHFHLVIPVRMGGMDVVFVVAALLGILVLGIMEWG